MSIIDSIFNLEDQLSSLWELKVHALDGSFDTLKYKVQDATLPFPQLNVERKFSGETVFKDFTEVEPITITMRESPDFSSYTFFKNWMDIFYDETNRVFNTFSTFDEYEKNLYNLEITFFKGQLLSSIISTLSGATLDASLTALCTKCKPIGMSSLSLSYDGGPLSYSITVQPLTVEMTVQNT